MITSSLISMEPKKGLLTLARLASVLIIVGLSPLRAQGTAISGIVTDSSAKPTPGALVRIRSEELGLSFMLVSQAQGRYRTPALLPGKYTVQGFGPDSQSEPRGPVEIRAGQAGQLDLTLSAPLTIPPPFKRMNDADYAKLMPEGKGKNIVVARCATCHDLDWIIAARKTPDEWQDTVERMRYDLQGRERPLNREEELTQLDPAVEYLGKTFTPNTPVDSRVVEQALSQPGTHSHPNRNLAGGFLKHASPYVAMEFSLPPNSMPRDLAVDSNGIAWVNESNSGILGRFDPDSMSYARIPVPSATTSKVQLSSIAIDPTGDVWFVDEGSDARMIQYKPKSKEFRSYPLTRYHYPIPPNSSRARLVSLRFLAGNVWAVGPAANWIVKLEPSTGKTTQYPVPHGSFPSGLAIGGDHRIWYAAEVGNFVGSLDPAAGRLKHFDVPTAKSQLRGMSADAEGNLWVAETAAGKLLKVGFRDGTLTEFDLPNAESGPYTIAVDTKHNVIWFSEIYADKIGRFDPKNMSFVEFPAPSADLDVRRLEIDQNNPNRVWWADGTGAKIGYVEAME